MPILSVWVMPARAEFEYQGITNPVLHRPRVE
jgi:hypothetical protein